MTKKTTWSVQGQLAAAIGRQARAARVSLDITAADVADRLGVSNAFYARLERGAILPTVQTLLRMAAVLGVTTDQLLGREPAVEPESAPRAGWIH